MSLEDALLPPPVVSHQLLEARKEDSRERMCLATCCGLVKVELHTGHCRKREGHGERRGRWQGEEADFVITRHLEDRIWAWAESGRWWRERW